MTPKKFDSVHQTVSPCERVGSGDETIFEVFRSLGYFYWTRKLYFLERFYVLPNIYPIFHHIHFLTQANKAKVLYGIPRDPDVAAALAELEEEENEGNAEDEKPKVCCECD